MAENCNGFIRDSLELYDSDRSKREKTYLDIESIFRGFEKVPLVLCERYDIKPYLNKIKLDMPPGLKKSNSFEPKQRSLEALLTFKECTVLLKREDLAELKRVFMNNSKKNHSTDTSLSCNICRKVYLSEKKLINHQQNKHMVYYKPKNKNRKRVSFSDKIIIHEVKEYHRCRKCPKIYEDYDSLRTHMKRVHKKRRCYICFYCSKDFIDRTFFKVHIKLHCSMCGLLLPNKKYYLEHKRTVCKNVKKYECKQCKAILFHFMDLKDHSYEHYGTYYICDICKDKFDNKCALAHHIKFLHSKRRPITLFTTYTAGIDRVHTCNFCEETSMDRDAIEKHVSTFPDYKKCATTYYKDFYFCDQCYEKFTTETDMLQHKWTHFLRTTDKNDTESTSNDTKTYYNVNETLPSFLQPKLILHKLMLPEPKVEKSVNFIDVTNFDLDNLKKPIVDPIRKKTLLSRHQCKKCNKYLSTNYCLNRHMYSVHGVGKDNQDFNDLQCNVCKEIFALPSLLQSHNCICMTIPNGDYSYTNSHLDNMYEVPQTCFDNINIDDSQDYMNSIDFEIPAPIVELTEYENLNIVFNSDNVYDNNKLTPFSNLQYVAVMQEVPIEF